MLSLGQFVSITYHQPTKANRTRFELRMCHYLAVILLCSSHIRKIDEVPTPKDSKAVLQMELGQRGVQVALKAVEAAVVFCRLPGHSPFVEPSAYALFVAVLCLITALPRVEGEMATDVQTRIEQGFHLMTHVSCLSLDESELYLAFSKASRRVLHQEHWLTLFQGHGSQERSL